MVYYASFFVDIESVTYSYPNKVRVTWEQADKPDLAATDIQATTPLVINSYATFQLRFDNGSMAIPDPFTVTLYQGATEWGRWTYPGALENQHFSESVTHLLPTSGAMNLTLIIDSSDQVVEANEANNTLTRSFVVGSGSITGDFDITPNTIHYRDPFQLVPKNISGTAGCTYLSHKFRLLKGFTWDSPTQLSPTAPFSFTYPGQYPNAISTGVVTVQMNITGSCGESGWITKLLTVNSLLDNHAPYFKLGWFSPSDNSGKIPYTQVLVGTSLQVRVIDDPPSPSDEDHDPFWINGWDFNNSSNWVKSLPGFYGFSQSEEKLTNITASTVGVHTIWATMTDPFGATSTASATIEVIPPNPIPRASCPSTVKENRLVDPSLFSASSSYSPAGRQINHGLDEWTNRQTSYINGTTSDLLVQASLHVWDNGSPALKSLSPSLCSIIVKPDLPPIGKLDVPPFAIRSQALDLYNKSYSTDGDVLVSSTYKYKYDAANDGFANDAWTSLAGNMTKATFTPPLVGKYLFEVTVCEDYGKCGSATATQLATSLTLDTINLAPEVSFQVLGRNEQPEVSVPSSYPVSTVFNAWNLYETNTNTLIADRGQSWGVSGNVLSSGMGRNFENPKPMAGITNMLPDYGYGNNGLSPYRSGVGSSIKSMPILVPNGSGWAAANMLDAYNNAKFRTNPKYMYFGATNGSAGRAIYAFNKSKIGNYTNVSPVPFEYYHRLDQNPYDFVINSSSIGGGAFITGFELADRTLYVSYQYQYYVDEGSTDEWGSPVYSTYTTIRLAMFDAFTGERVGMSTVNLPGANQFGYSSTTIQMLKRGDNIRYVGSYPYSGMDGGGTVYEFNRSGQLVSSKSLNQLAAPPSTGSPYYYNYKMNYSEFSKDMEGNLYRYEYRITTMYFNTNYISYDFAYLVKYNAIDMSLAWRVQLQGNMPGLWYNNGINPQILPDPFSRKIHVTSTNGSSSSSFFEALDMDTGAKSPGTDFRFGAITWSGSYVGISSSDIYGVGTIEGYYSHFAMNSSSPYNYIRKPDGSYPGSFQLQSRGTGDGWTEGNYSDQWHAAPQYFSALMGDGLQLTAAGQTRNGTGRGKPDVLFLNVLTPSTDPMLINPTVLGQFVSPFTLDNSELSFTLNMLDSTMDNRLTGFSFRMQDPMNRYAVETDGTTLYATRYTAGTRTVLQSIAYPFQSKLDYAFKIKMTGNQFEISLNGVPYLNFTDGTYASGKIGPVTDKSFVDFKGFSSKTIPNNQVEWLSNYAIWEAGTATAQVQYDQIKFTDPENDPRAGDLSWSYAHSPKFMNSQGVSALNGQLRTSEQLTFDKVGEYSITLQARDDPHPSYRYPSMTFDGYRKNTNAFQQRVIVHRRPIAAFTTATNGDGTISYNDTSYDPDRWVNAGSYSAPDTTGIDYGATRGIMERRFFYTAPSGGYVEAKLSRPTEVGVYTIGLVVRDEYGAWSLPVTQTITSGTIPAPNSKPTVALTFPYGPQGSPNIIYTSNPSITWNQYDTSGTVFTGYQVVIRKENGQLVAESGERAQFTSANTASWGVPTDLPAGVKLQVQVRVNDGETWSDWSSIGWMQVNSPPTAQLTFPSGTPFAPTIVQETRRPTIQFLQTDNDNGTIFQGGDIFIKDTNGNGVYYSAITQYTTSNTQSIAITSDLPVGVPLQVSVRTGDGSVWSDWSNTGWLMINSRPTAAVTQPLGTYAAPGVGGLRPLIQFRLADPEPATLFSQYQVWIGREDGSEVLNYTLTGLFSQTDFSYQVGTNLPAGLKLQVRVRGWDQYGLDSLWSPVQWFLTNRPPIPAFDWSPKPVWEGDVVSMINQSTDPDGDPLAYLWVIQRPDGSVLSTSVAAQPTQRFVAPGTYTVSLTVSDAMESKSVSHTIQVQQLSLQASVNHTAQWLAIHEERGHNTTVVPMDFYSGERFQLEAAVASAPVERVSATLSVVAMDGSDLDVTSELTRLGVGNTFRGELFDNRFLSLTGGLPEGVLTIQFEVHYVNGVVKTSAVPVRIIGNAQGVVTIHRRR